MLQILQKQLDESTFCPLCQASMYYVEAEEFEKEIHFHQCSHCHHQVFQNGQLTCHCETCQSKRKKMMKEILIVDDHVVVQTGVSIILEETFPDCKISTTENYSETLALLSERKIDLIILDINIPGGKNTEMVKEIKNIHPLVKVLIFSVYNAETHACAYIMAGADGYLNKLSDKEQITSAVDSIFKNGSYLPSEILQNLIKISTNKENSNTIDKLSKREKEITKLLLEGEGNIEIANKLNINLTTVSTHKNKIFSKLKIKNIIELSNLFKKIPGINN